MVLFPAPAVPLLRHLDSVLVHLFLLRNQGGEAGLRSLGTDDAGERKELAMEEAVVQRDEQGRGTGSPLLVGVDERRASQLVVGAQA